MISEDLRALVTDTLKRWDVHGCSIAIVKKREGKWETQVEGFGQKDDTDPVTPKTLFAIASNSKLFTALAIAIIIERSQGALQYSTKVRSIIPQFELKDPVATELCTLEDLLCHRTGLDRYNNFFRYDKLEQVVEIIKHCKPAADFRDKYIYNNWTYDLLAYIVQHVSGEPFDQFVKRNILDPLGMHSTTFSINEALRSGHLAQGYWRDQESPDDVGSNVKAAHGLNEGVGLRGAGGMLSCGEDMVHWLKFLLEEGQGEHQNIISQSFFHESVRGRTIVDVVTETPDLSSRLYGLARRIGSYQGVQFVEHGGAVAGYMTQVCIIREHRVGIALLTNGYPWGDLVYNIIKWRFFEESLGLKRVDWNERYLTRRRNELINEQKSLLFEDVSGTACLPPCVEDLQLIGLYHIGGMELRVSGVVPRSSLPRLSGIPAFPGMWGETSLVLCHRSGLCYDGYLRFEARSLVHYGGRCRVRVHVDFGRVVGIDYKNLVGAVPRTYSGSQSDSDLCLPKVE